MLVGAERAKFGRVSLFKLLCLGVGLYACGGRTIDDGVYGYQPTGSSSTCVYRGTTYRDGAFIAANCACFCNRGQIECEQGCTIASGGNSSGGNSSGGTVGVGNASNGGSSTGGSSGGTAGVGNAGGAAFGGSSGMTSGGSTGVSGSGVGGSVSTGGVAGTGGVPQCGTAPRATGIAPLIDDMEDGDSAILPHDGRSGGWFVYNDGSSGYQFPSLSAFEMQGGSDATRGEFSARTFGKGFSSWGAGMGFVLNAGCPYDASVHKGLHFFARGEFGPGSIFVLVATSATTPIANHGTCVPSSPTACYDNYQTEIMIGPGWSEQTIPFYVLNQQGWGTPAAFDPRTLINVNFQTLFGGGNSFSFSIDAVSFY